MRACHKNTKRKKQKLIRFSNRNQICSTKKLTWPKYPLTYSLDSIIQGPNNNSTRVSRQLDYSLSCVIWFTVVQVSLDLCLHPFSCHHIKTCCHSFHCGSKWPGADTVTDRSRRLKGRVPMSLEDRRITPSQFNFIHHDGWNMLCVV